MTPITRTLLAAVLVSTTALAGIHTERVRFLMVPTLRHRNPWRDAPASRGRRRAAGAAGDASRRLSVVTING
jgi:hypothetical protein